MTFVKFGTFAVDLELVAYMEDDGREVTIHFRSKDAMDHVLDGKEAAAARKFIAQLPDMPAGSTPPQP